MPSFLSKVFGRKKDSQDKETHSPVDVRASTPLDGKFEPVSPSATKFPEAVNGKSELKDKDSSPLSLFKPKSRHQQSGHAQKRVHAPHLSLNFPTLSENTTSPSLGVVFEVDPETLEPLPELVIGQRKLNPAETLSLVQICSQALRERGLETLGVMHPHWHSASPESQRKLLTLFIHSLSSASTSSSSPSPSAYATAFQNEVSSSRSPHDVAAILRWGLRHLQLESNQSGRDDKWFTNFSAKEREGDYPTNAFSVILPSQVPTAHLELLKTLLELVSYLGAHSAANGASGSRLSKFLGLWLFEAEQARNDDNWDAFYSRWERAGRILEHLFLARIRDEGASARLPTRLAELISKYPYGGSSPETGLLPRPRFSTYQHDALFVRVETEYTSSKAPKHHPFRLLTDAFKGDTTAEGDHVSVWESIKKTGADESQPSPGGYAGIGRVFDDETIRLLSRVPAATTDAESPFVRATSPSARKRSFSVGDKDGATPTSPVAFRSRSPPLASPTSPSKIQDWGDFMSSGFASEENEEANTTSLASTLIKAELEPRPASRNARNGHARKSLDAPRALPSMAEEHVDEASFVSKSTSVHIIKLDEAFIDFWSDALLDSAISSNWPGFVVCKLKPTLEGVEVDGQRVEWLVIERQYKRPAPPVLSIEGEGVGGAGVKRRPSSPKSVKSDLSINTPFKRLSFLGGSFGGKSFNKAIGAKKSGHKVGEMGEALAEEDEGEGEKKLTPPATEKSKSRTSLALPKLKVPAPKSKRASVGNLSRKSAEKPVETKEETPAVPAVGAATAVAATVVAGAAVVAVDAAANGTPTPAVEETKAEPEAKEVDIPAVAPAAEEATVAEPAPAEVSEPVEAAKEVEVPAANGHSPAVAEDKPAPIEETPAPIGEEPTPAPAEETPAPPAPVVPEETPAPVAEEPKPEPEPEVIAPTIIPTAEEPEPEVEPEVAVPAIVAVVDAQEISTPATTPEVVEPVTVEEPIAVAEAEAPSAVEEPKEEEQPAVQEPAVEEVKAPEPVADEPEPAPAPAEPTIEVAEPTPAEEPATVEEPTAQIVTVHEESVEPVAEPVNGTAHAEAAEKEPEEATAPIVAVLEEPERVEPTEVAEPAAEEPASAQEPAVSEPADEITVPEDVPPEVTQVLESSPHSEPLAVPEYTAGDNQVELAAVPIVDAVPEFPMEAAAEAEPVAPEPIAEATQSEDAAEPPVETVIAHGDTPGPQALLDHVAEEAEAPSTQVEEPLAAPAEEPAAPIVDEAPTVAEAAATESEEAKPAEP